MLAHIAVENFAILKNVDVDFNTGMTVLTGETGAGKSLLIDAIGLLLGDRARSDVVRTGEEFCQITGVFSDVGPNVAAALQALDISAHDTLHIMRRIHKNATNLIKINRRPVSLQELNTITRHLADIHSQHDTKRLVNPDSYLSLLDYFDPSIASLKRTYNAARRTYLDVLAATRRLHKKKAEANVLAESMREQREDIRKHALKSGEDTALETEISRLKNYDKIFQASLAAYEALEEKNALQTVFQAYRALEEAESFDKAYGPLKQRLESIYYELDDVKETVSKSHRQLDFDPAQLDALEARSHALSTLKLRYRKSIDEMIAYAAELEKELYDLEHFDAVLKRQDTVLKDAYSTLRQKAEALRERRQKAGEDIESALIRVLSDLELQGTRFSVVFNAFPAEDMFDETPFGHAGADAVDFHLSTNVGEALKPLSKVASGGELSRIMLALKELLFRNVNVSLLVFDEIDTGVSGRVAAAVADKMKRLSSQTQVIAITHVPQIAAAADHHYHIFKEAEAERTKAFVKTLSRHERIQEIAQMISSENVTEHAVKSAEALLGK